MNLELRLQDEEVTRQELEDTEIDIKQEEVRRLLMDYMVREPTPFGHAGLFHPSGGKRLN